MNKLRDYLQNKHGLLFKLGVFFCSLFFIVWILPNTNAFVINYELGKPWQSEDLIAPFDFAIYKSEAEILSEKNSIKQNIELYYQHNNSALEKQKEIFFAKNALTKSEQQIFDSVFTALTTRGIVELPDTFLFDVNPTILIENNKVVTEAHLQDFYTLVQADSFLFQALRRHFNESTSNHLLELSENHLTQTLRFNKTLTERNLQQQ